MLSSPRSPFGRVVAHLQSQTQTFLCSGYPPRPSTLSEPLSYEPKPKTFGLTVTLRKMHCRINSPAALLQCSSHCCSPYNAAAPRRSDPPCSRSTLFYCRSTILCYRTIARQDPPCQPTQESSCVQRRATCTATDTYPTTSRWALVGGTLKFLPPRHITQQGGCQTDKENT